MGREIKRVPLGFEYKIGKTWIGYLNPYSWHSEKCSECDGTGSSKEAKRLSDQWYGNAPFKPEDRGSKPWTITDAPIRRFAERNIANSPSFYGSGEEAIIREANRLCELFNTHWCHHLNDTDVKALIKAGRLHDFTHTWTQGKGWQEKNPKFIPTAQQVNEWSVSGGMGHDGCNQWAVVRAECKRLGYKYTCSNCNGNGSLWHDKTIKRKHDHWKPVEPPKGMGFQLWETVSEGSPISPVFATPEELAKWLEESPDYTWKRNDAGTTYEEWLAFIKRGWAPSLVSDGKTIMSGVKAVAAQAAL